MKLILKRLPRGAQSVDIAARAATPSYRPNDRPLALFSEDGEILPAQQSVILNSLPGQCPTVTVTFFLNWEDVKLAGDE